MPCPLSCAISSNSMPEGLCKMSNLVRPPHHTRPWPVLRNAVVSFMNTQRPNSVQGFGEIDVTDALAAIRRAQKTLRTGVSFHAYVLHCLVQALVLHPTMVSYRYRNQLIAFDDIDVLTPVEKHLSQGGRIPVAHVVRGAQAKSLAQINWDLRQAVAVDDLAAEEAVKLRRRFAGWPRLLRDFVSRRTRRDPFLLKRLHGTVILTNVQPPGFSNTFCVSGPTIHTLSIAVGTITERIKLDEEGRLTARKILTLGGAADHDIVDGMTAARFASDLVRLVESGQSLDASFIEESRRLMEQSKS